MNCLLPRCKLNHNHKFGCACNEKVPEALFFRFVKSTELLNKYKRSVCKLAPFEFSLSALDNSVQLGDEFVCGGFAQYQVVPQTWCVARVGSVAPS